MFIMCEESLLLFLGAYFIFYLNLVIVDLFLNIYIESILVCLCASRRLHLWIRRIENYSLIQRNLHLNGNHVRCIRTMTLDYLRHF